MPKTLTLIVDKRVKKKQLRDGLNAGTEKYLLILHATTAELLSCAGYASKNIYDAVNGYRGPSLTTFQTS